MFGKRVIIPLVIALCVGVLVLATPAVMRAAGRWHQRPTCNLLQIGLAMIQYAGDHEDRFPESFGVLLKEGYLTTGKCFIDPHTGSEVPEGWPGVEDYREADLAVLDRVHDFGDYAMAKGLTHADDAEAIVAYEKRPIYRMGRGCFFNCGYRQWLPEEEFREHLSDQQARLRERPQKIIESGGGGRYTDAPSAELRARKPMTP